jgi:hypothetical protein
MATREGYNKCPLLSFSINSHVKPTHLTMSLWVDKHRPTSLAKLSLHGELTKKLQSLASCDELPHLLFYGPPGKTTPPIFSHLTCMFNFL